MPETLTAERPHFWELLESGRPYHPMPWQNLHIHARSNVSNLIIGAGRRSGKSHGVKAEVVREIERPSEFVMGIEHFPIIYVIGPTSELAMRVFEPIWDLFVPSDSGTYQPPLGFLHQWHDKARGVIQLTSGARIFRKTGDDPRSMQGERVTLAITDETQDMPDEVWEKLLPSLADSGGRLIAIGVTTKKGRFRSFWHLGQGVDPNFYSASVPTSVNPRIREIAQERGYVLDEYIHDVLGAGMTEKEIRQQFYAEWLDEEGQVFRHYEQYFDAPRYRLEGTEFYRPKGTYLMGLDVGKKRDFMSAHVIDVGQQTFVDSERFIGIDYTVAGPRLANLARAWGCKFIHMDNTGIGEGLADILRAEGISIVPFTFTNESKARLIGRFASEIERGRVRFLQDDDVLKKELGLFEATLTGTTITYGAPKGYHDDAVVSAALAVYKSAVNRQMAHSPTQRPYITFQTDGPRKPRFKQRRKVAA
jgi:hypothetical protein